MRLALRCEWMCLSSRVCSELHLHRAALFLRTAINLLRLEVLAERGVSSRWDNTTLYPPCAS